MSDKSLQIMSEYAEFGHMGNKERQTTWKLVTDSPYGNAGNVTLVREVVKRNFPDDDSRSVNEHRIIVSAAELVEWFESHSQ